jgi:hypothetical protein
MCTLAADGDRYYPALDEVYHPKVSLPTVREDVRGVKYRGRGSEHCVIELQFSNIRGFPALKIRRQVPFRYDNRAGEQV